MSKEVMLGNDYKLEFKKSFVSGELVISAWARRQWQGWQWFCGKFPFEDKFDGSPEWRKAWKEAQ